MRLALIVPAPFETLSGGYAYDRRMVAGLRAAGHTVDVVELGGPHPVADEAAREAARAALAAYVNDGTGAQIVIDGLALPAFTGQGDSLAAAGAIGLVHHPTAFETGFSGSDRASLRNTELRLLPRLARVIVTSAITAERLGSDFGVDPTRITAIVPGTEDCPRSEGSSAPGCAILSVGTLVPRKGHDVLLRALSRLLDLDWRLVIVGSAARNPVHARELAELSHQLGIAERVQFAGEIDKLALDALWRKADLFALASHWEGYGMAVAEALKRGLPIAATAGGAAAALVSPEAGVVAPPGDHDQLSKAMRRLIFSPSLRREMADVAWEAGRELPSWETQIQAFARALETRRQE
jgi:glycosyltransferase involved in cell wall biosynthesis